MERYSNNNSYISGLYSAAVGASIIISIILRIIGFMPEVVMISGLLALAISSIVFGALDMKDQATYKKSCEDRNTGDVE